MALFKIEKGLAASLATARPTTNEGWCYFTKDDGKFYIDIETGNDLTKRVCLNANTADKLTCGTVGDKITPVYFEDGIPQPCEQITTETLTINVNGTTAGTFDGSEAVTIDINTNDGDYLPLTAGEEKKLTGPLGLTQDIMYGTILPEDGFEGQLFFLEDESSGEYLPGGGTAGQALIKNSNAEGDASWQDIVALPDGGTAGQALVKNSDAEGDASWQDIVALPKGGDIGQALIKVSAEDGDAEWKEIVALPKGGAQGQILTKNSSTDGDAAWQNFPELNYLPLTGGTITGGIILNSQNYVDFLGTNFAITIKGSDSVITGIGAMNSTQAIALYLTPDGEMGLSDRDGNSIVHKSPEGHYHLGPSGVYSNGSVLYGAAWNDYAEYRTQIENIEPGYCVASADDGRVYKTTEKFQACDGIVSDTFGFAIGETDECKTPLAVAGRVLAYCEGNRYDYHSGDTVCAGPDGRVCKMTREEIREWPDRIIGIVSEIPEYETWGTGNVNVNGRIWIKVK